jgi:hypothetical protein
MCIFSKNKSLYRLDKKPVVGNVYYLTEFSMISDTGGGVLTSRPVIVVKIFTDDMGKRFVKYGYYNPDKPFRRKKIKRKEVCPYDDFIRDAYLNRRRSLIL